MFVGLGVLMASGMLDSSRHSSEFDRVVGWLSILFGGFGTLKAALGLIWPTQLRLNSAGFQVVERVHRPLVPWSSVDRFFTVEIRGTKIVVYDLKPESKSGLANVWARHRPQWGDGYLPTMLGMSADTMLELVEDWRHRHAAFGQ